MERIMKDPYAAWLNLPDAAQYISYAAGKPFSEAAVLQLAMELRLTLSVIVDTPTWAHECEIVTYDLDKLNAEIASGIYTEKLLWREWNGNMERASPCLGGNKFLNAYDRFTSLQGLYDLPFFGDAWITVENKLWEVSGNQKTDRPARYGVFLEDGNGNIFRLKDIKPDQKAKLSDNALLVVKKTNLDKSDWLGGEAKLTNNEQKLLNTPKRQDDANDETLQRNERDSELHALIWRVYQHLLSSDKRTKAPKVSIPFGIITE